MTSCAAGPEQTAEHFDSGAFLRVIARWHTGVKRALGAGTRRAASAVRGSRPRCRRAPSIRRHPPHARPLGPHRPVDPRQRRPTRTDARRPGLFASPARFARWRAAPRRRRTRSRRRRRPRVGRDEPNRDCPAALARSAGASVAPVAFRRASPIGPFGRGGYSVHTTARWHAAPRRDQTSGRRREARGWDAPSRNRDRWPLHPAAQPERTSIPCPPRVDRANAM